LALAQRLHASTLDSAGVNKKTFLLPSNGWMKP
jgi:hypothetical protein